MKKAILLSIFTVIMVGASPAHAGGNLISEEIDPFIYVPLSLAIAGPAAPAVLLMEGMRSHEIKKQKRYVNGTTSHMSIAPAPATAFTKPKAPRHTHRQYD